MNIVLLGYGKMGQLIEKFVVKRGHEVVLIVDEHNRSEITAEEISKADVAIDFSTPHAALDNIALCFDANLPIVVGTTGWYDHLQEIQETCHNEGKALLYGSNFSIGVNIFFHVNKMLAKRRYIIYTSWMRPVVQRLPLLKVLSRIILPKALGLTSWSVVQIR
jgi:4-hydroxy-tetrahydrodipicolinate reductase